MSLLSALVTSLAWAALALPTTAGGKSVDLTPETFKSTVSNGLWFVESFSPYCHHCTAFAPTWDKLVADVETEIPSVNMARVDCSVHGDLCTENGVTGYPTLQMYDSGKMIEKFTGVREMEKLKAFISKHVKVEAPKPVAVPAAAPVTLNPNGEVLVLDSASFASSLKDGPTFVKFYAPWCGHCKKLAPVWKQLARHLQNKVQIAEVNCDDHSALCASHKIQGYPTLKFFAGGAESEYNGGRKLENLKAFVEKAASDGVRPLQDLDTHLKEEPVVYLLFHKAGDEATLTTVREAAAPLLGSPIVYSSSDDALRAKYKVPSGVPWAIIALKDGDASTITSALYGGPTITQDKLKNWLVSHTLPGAIELYQDTFQSVMNAKHKPLVVIVASNDNLSHKIEERVRDIAKKWRVRTNGSGVVNGREVIFSWMNGQRWKEWMSKMYGVQVDEAQADIDASKVVVADHQRLVYWDSDKTGSPLKLTSSSNLFNALEDIATEKTPYKNSENFVERLARYLSDKMTSLESYIANYPLRFVAWIVGVLAIVFFLLTKLIGSDAARIEGGEYVRVNKGSRLD